MQFGGKEIQASSQKVQIQPTSKSGWLKPPLYSLDIRPKWAYTGAGNRI